MSGVSWLGVLSMARPPLRVGDEPAPAAAEPAGARLGELLLELGEARRTPWSIAVASAPLGSLAPPGAIISQNSVWLAWPPPLFRTGVRIASGSVSMLASSSSMRLLLEVGVRLERRVQVVDVGAVVLVVMDPHRLLVDVRLQGVVVVGQGGKGERHDRLLNWKLQCSE